MSHLHLVGILTFEFLTLIAATFLAIYMQKQQVSTWLRNMGKIIVLAMLIIIAATLIHAIVHHFAAHGHLGDHHQMMEKHLNHKTVAKFINYLR